MTNQIIKVSHKKIERILYNATLPITSAIEGTSQK